MAETPLHSVKIMSSNAREEEAWEPTQEALRLTDKYYIERRVDAYLKGILHRRHLSATITIYGSHQSGKSSLLIRGLYDARQTGAKVVLVDMQSLSDQCFTSLDNLNYSLAEILFRKLQLDVGKLRDLWNHELTSWNKLHHLIEDYIYRKLRNPL